MTDPDKTLLVALLDRTGSMGTIKTDAEGAFDAFIQALRDDDADDEVAVTLWQFDKYLPFPPSPGGHDVVELCYENVPLADVPPLVIQPRGTTPLYDALALTITWTGEQLAVRPEVERPGKVIFVVITDGEENSSREHVGSEGATYVKSLVERQTNEWSWSFHFLGVGIDAWATSSQLGFVQANTVQSDRTGAGMRQSYAGAMGMSVNTARRKR